MEQVDNDINGPHQGAWITAQDGRDWFLHFQDRGAYGRITHLNPVNWIDGWPVMGTVKDQKYCGYPVTTFDKPVKGETKKTPQESDEFNSHKLGLQWSWHANPQDTWGYPSTNGYYRLYAQPLPEGFKNFWDVPNLLLQKFPAETFTATTKLELLPQMDYPVEYHNYTDKEKAGLIVMGMDYSYVALVRDGDKFKLQQVICKKADKGSSETIVKEIPVKSNKIELRVSVKKDAVCKFSYSENGKNFKEFGEIGRAHV